MKKTSPFLQWLCNHTLILIGIVVGLLAGFLYWWLVGCNSGSCPIASSPLISALGGGALGGLLFSMFKKCKHCKCSTPAASSQSEEHPKQ